MGELHVVVGAGPVGRAVATNLVDRGRRVRILNRTGSARIDGAEPLPVDVSNASAARRAFRGATVVYQCAQPAYHRWGTEFAALQRAIVDAAADASAGIVIADNLYAYGDPRGAVLTERSPEHTATHKGILRRQMAAEALAAHAAGRLQVAISRPANYFGPGYDQLGSMVFSPALGGKPMRFLGRADQPHSFSYIPDVGAAMAELGTVGGGWGRVWIPPVQPALTQAEFATRIWTAAGRTGAPRLRLLGRRMATLLGLFSPTLRELPEMMYEFEAPYVVSSSEFQSTFGSAPTPLDAAIAATLESYRVSPPASPRAIRTR